MTPHLAGAGGATRPGGAIAAPPPATPASPEPRRGLVEMALRNALGRP